MNGAMDWIQQSGWMGWVWFTAIYTFTCVFFLPGSMLTVGAGAVYGWLWGTLLVTLASTVGAAVNFLTSRYLARDWIQRKLGASPRFHALEQAIGRGWKLILLSRISPVVPHSLVSYAAGLTSISFTRFLVASFIGFLPLSAAYAYAGAVVGKVARTKAGVMPHDWTSWTFTILGLIATVGVAVWSVRAASRAFKKAETDQAPK